MLNFTPVPRRGYRIGLPRAGQYREIFNSDSHRHGGSDIDVDVGNGLLATNSPWTGRPPLLQ